MSNEWVDAEGNVEVTLDNRTDIPDSVLWENAQVREVASALQRWHKDVNQDVEARHGRSGLFSPGKYAAADNPYEMMRIAQVAAEDDDVVSTAIEVTEGLAIQSVTWEGGDNVDVADIFNQISEDLNLDGYIRKLWRELEIYSQCVTAALWHSKEFTPSRPRESGKTNKDGSRRVYPARKGHRLRVPRQLITLDPGKVVPIGVRLFGEDRLAWHATEDEAHVYSGGDLARDAVMLQMVKGRYRPTDAEAREFSDWGVDVSSLLELDPKNVWRHCINRSDYEKFAPVRMKSVFRLLDMKQQLYAADRVALVGNANYILLVKVGDKDKPASNAEVSHTRESFRSMAKLPVVVADHRLVIEILTPAMDNTLKEERYNVIDRRIIARLLSSPSVPGSVGNAESGLQSKSRMMSRTLESRRKMIKRFIEKHLRDAIYDDPANADVVAKLGATRPSLVFTPRNVQLDQDAHIISAIMAARQQNDLSRRTLLELLGYDENAEWQRIQDAEERYEKWELAVPFNSPANDAGGGDDGDGDGGGGEPSGVSGRRGGRPVGGGQTPNSAKKQVRSKTASGAPSTRSNGD